MSIVIKRPWLEEFLKRSGRRLLYGRRKTGKTFYARLVLRDYQYFIVRRGGVVYDPFEDQSFDLSAFLRICRSSDYIIVDEFHRLDPRFFDALQASVCCENLVLITSTLHYYKRFIEGREAPLLGLFSSRRVGLITPLELLSYRWSIEREVLFKHLVFYQEPTLIGWSLKDIVYSGREFARSLVGEVLEEEDYVYTRRFNAILGAIACGRNKLSEIAMYLYSRGLLDKPSTSLITKYIDIMVKTGLLERIEVWGRRRKSIYRHVSPLTETIYYLDTRYGFYDIDLEWGFIEKALNNIIPLLIEKFIERLLAELYGLKPVKILEPEIDIALVEYKQLRIVAEVKWVNKLSKREVLKIEEKLNRFPETRKILIVPDQSIVPETSLEVWDIEKIMKLSSRKQRNLG